jgi:uncharacterized protein (TIGR03067 family)
MRSIQEARMIQPKCFWCLGRTWAMAAACVFTALALSAPAAEDESKLDSEVAAEPVKATEEEAAENLKQSRDNLEHIAVAFNNYAAVTGEVPENITDKDGNVLLSWRVQILPFVDQDELFKKFKLDEPWDSKNNRELVVKMPEIYSSPRVVVKKKGYTVYQGFAGAGALFQTGKKLRFPASIPDGTSNTILAVESSMAVPWTKPADLPFDEKKDLPDFGKAYHAKPLAALCDGSVRTLNLKKITPKTLKAAITIAGGEVLGADWEAPSAEEKKLDLDSLVGTWTFQSGAKAGLIFPGEGLRGTWTVTKETFTLRATDEEIVWLIKYKLDTTQSPVAIDLDIKDKGTALGIIRLEGNELTLCFGETRPNKFESTKSNGATKYVLKKKKE